jgi:hypothetical protein
VESLKLELTAVLGVAVRAGETISLELEQAAAALVESFTHMLLRKLLLTCVPKKNLKLLVCHEPNFR